MPSFVAPIGSPVQLHLDGALGVHGPSIVGLADGGYALALSARVQRKGADPFVASVTVHDADGTARGDPFEAETDERLHQNGFGAEMTALPGGGFVVAWFDAESNRWTGRILGSDGRPDGKAYKLFDDVDVRGITLASTEDGFVAAAAAYGKRDGGAPSLALVRAFDADGEPMGRAETLSKGHDVEGVKLHEGRDGRPVVTWREGFDGEERYLVHLDRSGKPLGQREEVDLLYGREAYIEDEVLVPGDRGRSLMIYRDTYAGDLTSARLGPDGDVEGRPSRFGFIDPHDSEEMVTTVLSDGSVMAAWIQQDWDDATLFLQWIGSDGSVKGKTFEMAIDADGLDLDWYAVYFGSLEIEGLASGQVAVTWSVGGIGDGVLFQQFIATDLMSNAIRGGRGDDHLRGTWHDDVIVGLNGDDTLRGRSGSDDLYGGAGRDSMNGGSGNDRLRGENGADRLEGDGGNDHLLGGGGRDRLEGGDGDDRLRGGAGTDRLRGGDGRDVIDGGAGRDVAWGGKGRDTFVFSDGDDVLVIRDFQAGRDVIELDHRLIRSNGDAVVEEHASIRGGDAVLDFEDGALLRIEGVTDLSVIEDALRLV